MGIAFTYRDVKGEPLTDAEIDANFRAADAAVDALQDAAFQVDRFEADVDEGVFEIFLLDGRSSGPIPMPSRPFRVRGAWAPAVQYVQGDVLTVRKADARLSGTPAGLYRAEIAHQSTTLDADRGAGKIVLMVEAGEDGSHYEGAWVSGRPYTAFSTVLHQYTTWQCYRDVEAGAEPGVDFDTSGPYPVPIWFALTSPPRRLVKAAWTGKPAAGAASSRDLIERTCLLRAGMPGSMARLETAATAATTFSIQRNGSQVATCAFAAGSTVGTFTLAADTPILPGDRIRIVAPTPQDATAADPTFTVVLTVLG